MEQGVLIMLKIFDATVRHVFAQATVAEDIQLCHQTKRKQNSVYYFEAFLQSITYFYSRLNPRVHLIGIKISD